MIECKFITKIIPNEGSPIYKCSKNNVGNSECYLKIKEHLKNDNVIPNGECPYVHRNTPLSDCPCYE